MFEFTLLAAPAEILLQPFSQSLQGTGLKLPKITVEELAQNYQR